MRWDPVHRRDFVSRVKLGLTRSNVGCLIRAAAHTVFRTEAHPLQEPPEVSGDVTGDGGRVYRLLLRVHHRTYLAIKQQESAFSDPRASPTTGSDLRDTHPVLSRVPP